MNEGTINHLKIAFYAGYAQWTNKELYGTYVYWDGYDADAIKFVDENLSKEFNKYLDYVKHS